MDCVQQVVGVHYIYLCNYVKTFVDDDLANVCQNEEGWSELTSTRFFLVISCASVIVLCYFCIYCKFTESCCLMAL